MRLEIGEMYEIEGCLEKAKFVGTEPLSGAKNFELSGTKQSVCVRTENGLFYIFGSNITIRLPGGIFHRMIKIKKMHAPDLIPKKMHAPALVRHYDCVKLSEQFFASEDEARDHHGKFFIQWPAYEAEWPEL